MNQIKKVKAKYKYFAKTDKNIYFLDNAVPSTSTAKNVNELDVEDKGKI